MVRFPCRVQTAGIQGVLLHIKPQPMLAERLCSNHFSFSRLTSSDLRLDTSLLPSLGIEEVIYIYIYIYYNAYTYIYISLSLSLSLWYALYKQWNPKAEECPVQVLQCTEREVKVFKIRAANPQ